MIPSSFSFASSTLHENVKSFVSCSRRHCRGEESATRLLLAASADERPV
jgi:hypothetical protein